MSHNNGTKNCKIWIYFCRKLMKNNDFGGDFSILNAADEKS